MRKIGTSAVVRFVALVTAEAGVALYVTAVVIMPRCHEDFRGIAAVASAIVLFYLLAIAVFRLMQHIAPIPTGEIPPESPLMRRVDLYLLHYLLLFNPLIFSSTLPVPLMRLVLQALGARMGPNSYSAGIMMDPQFVVMGKDSIVGNGALIVPHALEGERMGFYPVRIGDRVTIGARAIIMADVEIGDDAIVAMQSVVTKGTRIGAGETWGGTPARRLK